MSTITIYYYTAWNGYSWQGCDDATAAGLQQYMEAAGVLPGDAGREPPFGGAIACQVGGCMGVAVYRCGIRSKGDAFGRDSLFISLAFVPLEYGPADFSAIMSLSQMSPSVKGELVPVSVPMSDIALPSMVRRDGSWRDESFNMQLNGISGLREASSFFFVRSCQLGLMQATFASSTGSVAGVSVSLSYHVFPEVAALAEASRAYADAKKLSRGTISDEHPVSMKLWDAVNQLQTRRIDKMPGYTGLAEYLTERDSELGGVISRVSAYARRTMERQPSTNVAATASPYGAPNLKRSAKTSSGRLSRLPYLFVTIGIMLVVGFAVAVIISRLSELKERRNDDVRLLEGKIKKLENERDQAKEGGERELAAARAQWKEERQGLDDKISRLEDAYNSAMSSNGELRVELDNARVKLASVEKSCRERLAAATNDICNIGQKRVDDALDIVKVLSETARQFPGAEVAKAVSAKARILDGYKGRDKIIVDVRQQDEYIAKLKALEKEFVNAFEEAHKRAQTKESDFRELNDINLNLRAEVEGLKRRLSSQARGMAAESPARYAYDVKYEKLGDKDWVPHGSGVFALCRCWRCRKSEHIRQEAIRESGRLESDAGQLKEFLAALKQARKEAEEKDAAVYAKADYAAAMSKYDSAHANDVSKYKTLLNDAIESFKKAGAKAEEATSKGKKASKEDALTEKPKDVKPQK